MSAVIKWEYISEYANYLFDAKTLDAYGQNGWELVQIVVYTGGLGHVGYTHFFKRPVE